jgi:small subunit ribosomal protein S2
MLTNFRTIHDRIKRMNELEDMISSGAIEGLTKKEGLRLTREYEKLARNLRGLKDMNKAPEAVYILDTKKEEIAVREAKKLGLPIVAILDTNSDPDDVDYGIPGNDDAIRSGALLSRIIADAVIEGKQMRGPEGGAEKPEPQAAKTPEEVLVTAAAQPKAEWELQLEAEEAAATDQTGTTTDQTSEPGTTEAADPAGDEPGDKSHPRPDDTSTEKG